MTNPFTPTFGIVPPYMAGRKTLLGEMRKAFSNWPGNPNLSSIIIGPRGSGKTALLSCIGDDAKQSGWIVADTIAGDGMLEDIYQRTREAAANLLGEKNKKHLTGLTIGQFLGLSWETAVASEINWRGQMGQLLRKLSDMGIGLLITVDEVRANIPEMIQLASIYQLFVRENIKIAIVMAGLPAHIRKLVSNEAVSFLRRSRQHYLSRISDRDVRTAFNKTIESGGKSIEDAALDIAVRSSGGYAYMIQLVGYSIWEESENTARISLKHAETGIRRAYDDFRSGVLDSTYRELSKGDRAFLFAMLEDKKYSTLADITRRLGKKSGYTATYKSRMLLNGIIEEQPGHTFSFAIPAFRDYLEEMKNTTY